MKSNISPKDEIIAKARKTLDKDIVAFIDECMKKEYPNSYLIAILHKVQEKYSYLSMENLQAIAYLMDIPSSKISGVASFYHYFSLKPKGKYVISVCMGTACFVKGAEKVINKLKEELNIALGATTEDKMFTLLETRCLGMCAMAPVLKIGDDIYSKVEPKQIPKILKKYKSN
ncbi:MAG: NADP-reducing hydrogenase subunit HndA [Candidatus Anoxychlamydiales bacterium]|nr:NADP-reducing hydrogenase subunit HndA [Candidatus Anoxychlamydiales bacterium]